MTAQPTDATSERTQVADMMAGHGHGPRDADHLIRAGFTAAQVADYLTTWGPTGDTSADALVRLRDAGIDPDLAGKLAAAGAATVNQAIANWRTFTTDWTPTGLDVDALADIYLLAHQHPAVTPENFHAWAGVVGISRNTRVHPVVQLVTADAYAQVRWRLGPWPAKAATSLAVITEVIPIDALHLDDATTYEFLMRIVVDAFAIDDQLKERHPHFRNRVHAWWQLWLADPGYPLDQAARLSTDDMLAVAAMLPHLPGQHARIKQLIDVTPLPAGTRQVSAAQRAQIAAACPGAADSDIARLDRVPDAAARISELAAAFPYRTGYALVRLAIGDDLDGLTDALGHLPKDDRDGYLDALVGTDQWNGDVPSSVSARVGIYLAAGFDRRTSAWLAIGCLPGGRLLVLAQQGPAVVIHAAQSMPGVPLSDIDWAVSVHGVPLERLTAAVRAFPREDIVVQTGLAMTEPAKEDLATWLPTFMRSNPDATLETVLRAIAAGLKPERMGMWDRRKAAAQERFGPVITGVPLRASYEAYQGGGTDAPVAAWTSPARADAPQATAVREQVTARVESAKERYGTYALDLDTFVSMPALMAKGYPPLEEFLSALVAFQDLAWAAGTSDDALSAGADRVEATLETAVAQAREAGLGYLSANDPDLEIEVLDTIGRVKKTRRLARQGTTDAERATGAVMAAKAESEALARLGGSLGGPAELASRLALEAPSVRSVNVGSRRAADVTAHEH